MTPKQFKPIILRTLREGKKFQTVDAFADYLVGKMEDFEDMFSMALEVAGTQPQIQFTPFPESVSRQEYIYSMRTHCVGRSQRLQRL